MPDDRSANHSPPPGGAADSGHDRSHPSGYPGPPLQRAPKSNLGERTSTAAKRVIREITEPGGVHPALIPGIGVEATGRRFATNRLVFAVAGTFTLVFILWGLLDTEAMGRFSSKALDGVSTNFGWLFSLLTLATFGFMMVVGFGPRGRIPLGADNEKPEFSTVSWIAMLFSAGMGIGLLFYGPYEPLVYFLEPPHGFDVDPESREAMFTAMAQTMFHWGPLAWSYYALVGGAIAYAAYRRGRSPLISSIFEPIFSERTKAPLGAVIDMFAIIVTLFGTAVSLGIGALQIARGVEIVGGIGKLGNSAIIAIVAVLTAGFIISAVSGVKRGIRALSNINMLLVTAIGLFAFVGGPTLFLLNFVPSSGVAYFHELATMLQRSAADGPATADFMKTWTTFYWAWWVSWTPFVGMFIAKISRGRTIRQFVSVVILVPSVVCLVWFGIFGGTAMSMQRNGLGVADQESSQDIMFAVLSHLPLSSITPVVVMIAVVIFFVTSADSASIVMGSITQGGQPVPSKWVTIVWGIALSGIAVTLLLAGGQNALDALQSLVTVSALPFAFVVIGVMVAWWRDLSTDPMTFRLKYARVALAEGVKIGIAEHGDDFVFGATASEPDKGAGQWLDSDDPALRDWYDEAVTGTQPVVVPDPPSAGDTTSTEGVGEPTSASTSDDESGQGRS